MLHMMGQSIHRFGPDCSVSGNDNICGLKRRNPNDFGGSLVSFLGPPTSGHLWLSVKRVGWIAMTLVSTAFCV